MTTTNTTLQKTIDNPWKEVVTYWLEPCLQSLWPNIHQKIDWDAVIERIEFDDFGNTSEGDNVNDCDLLYQPTLKENEACLIWIHMATKLEQSQDLAEKLCYIAYRLLMRYKQPILPLVIMLNTDAKLHIKPYQITALGYPIHRFQCESVNLHQWLGQEETLLNSDNHFENIIGTYLKTYSLPVDLEARYQLKLALHQSLLAKSCDKETFLRKYQFMDTRLPLSEALHKRYYEAIYQLERQAQVDYLTNSHEFGVDQWIQKGVEHAKRDLLRKMIARAMDRTTMKEMLDPNISDAEFNKLLIFEYSDESPRSVTDSVNTELQSI